jgi:vitamin B12 transporter
VTIQGANGYVASGRAILDFGGEYPQLFDADTKRRSIYAQSDYRFAGKLLLTSGFRYEHEHGFTLSSSRSETHRDNFSYFLEGQASLRQRFYANLGVGLEENAVFQFAATPRVSLAYYLRRPATDAFFGSTKLRSNFGTGIKEPSIFNEGASLYSLLSKLPQGPNLISKFGISPIQPERSRSFDAGLEQGLWRERARVRLTFFDNRFFDLMEFVRNTALPQLGVPPDVAAASGFGAAVNSGSYRSKGVELEGEAHFGRGLIVRANYDYLDAIVTRSFSGNALRPAFNPLFPQIPIGAFGPLVGNRPFRRSPHSGSLWVDYSRGRFVVNVTGYFVGRQDDSTFLSDEFFGNSLLLPNENLNAGYQKIDWSGRWSASRISTFYISVENALSQQYHAAFGYPALPLTVRAGMQFTLGGEGWGVK